MAPRQSAAFVGLGLMGGPMATRLLEAGWELHGYNRTRERAAPLVERGLQQVNTPRDAAAAAATVVVSMYDDDALDAVIGGDDGILAGVRSGATIVDTSTVRPSTSERLAARVAERDASLLHAPVSGNPVAVAAGNLTFLCSGDRADFDAQRGLFEAIGRASHYLGPGEEARYAKLALNLMIANSMQMLAEALVLTQRAGLPPAAMLEMTQQSAVGSPFVAYKAGPLIEEDYSPTFTVEAMRKDMEMLFEVSGELGVPVPASRVVDELLAECEELGWGERDFASLVALERKRAGAHQAG
jgi:3-hydroxyisobutyrate dehydrogenase-like beta-hydroxyacid dehydrogenase